MVYFLNLVENFQVQVPSQVQVQVRVTFSPLSRSLRVPGALFPFFRLSFSEKSLLNVSYRAM